MARIQLPSEREVWRYALQVPIATKDYGVRPITPWGTQKLLLQRILAGLAHGVNQFVVVKARQVGISTFMLLLTLLWMERFAGLQGLTVTDSDENKQYFRDLFLSMAEELQARLPPEERPEFGETNPAGDVNPGRLRARNQVQIAWHNQSRLLLQTAGKRTWSRLGVGRGLSFLHGTEVGLWTQGQKAVTYLRSAFSETNPAALYVFEGTARGKNWFYDLWESAVRAKTIDAVFISWWLREDNVLTRQRKKLWSTYGMAPLSDKEREWDRILRKKEKVILTPEQWAWRRWYLEEKAGGNHRLADQEMPTVPEDAFEASQERPFLDEVTAQRIKSGLQEPVAGYVYKWGTSMEDTTAIPAGTKEPMLRVWGVPDQRPTVIAAVPGYSTMEDDPSWVVSVWAASLEQDKLEQVAEFHTELNLGLQPFAWVCLHLAGAYGAGHKTFILEVAGLGMGVLGEIKRLVTYGYGTSRKPHFQDVLSSVRHYIWRRPDTFGAYGALQWKSTPENEATALQRFRDQIQRGAIIVRSEALALELSRLEGKDDGYTPAGDSPRGHRAFAGALANESYVSQLYPTLQRIRVRGLPARSVQERTLQDFFGSIGRR